MAGPPPGFGDLMAQKYAILGEHADAAMLGAQAGMVGAQAQGTRASAESRLMGAQTGQVAPNAAAARALDFARAGQAGAESGYLGALSKNLGLEQYGTPDPVAAALGRRLNAGQLTAGDPTVSADDAVGLRQSLTGGSAPNTTPRPGGGGVNFDDLYRPPVDTHNGQAWTEMGGQGGSISVAHAPGYASGTAKVPGKGSGMVDKVPAMLAPGEAVLNKGAAEHFGRDNIAALNSLGHAKMQAEQGARPPAQAAPQKAPQKPAGGPPAKPAPSAPAKGAKPAGRPGAKPETLHAAKGCTKVQELSKGTHEVKVGKSATTPKIAPGALQALAGMLGQGGGGGTAPPALGPGGAGGPPQRGGGMV